MLRCVCLHTHIRPSTASISTYVWCGLSSIAVHSAASSNSPLLSAALSNSITIDFSGFANHQMFFRVVVSRPHPGRFMSTFTHIPPFLAFLPVPSPESANSTNLKTLEDETDPFPRSWLSGFLPCPSPQRLVPVLSCPSPPWRA